MPRIYKVWLFSLILLSVIMADNQLEIFFPTHHSYFKLSGDKKKFSKDELMFIKLNHDSVFVVEQENIIEIPQRFCFFSTNRVGNYGIEKLGELTYPADEIMRVERFLRQDSIESTSGQKFIVKEILSSGGRSIYENALVSPGGMILWRFVKDREAKWAEPLWIYFQPAVVEIYQNVSSRRKTEIFKELKAVLDYLNAFDYESELARSKQPNFTITDPAGTENPYAPDMAFIFRRERELRQSNIGSGAIGCMSYIKNFWEIINLSKDSASILSRSN